MEGSWDFVKWYDTLDPHILLKQLSKLEYGATKTALTLLVHCAPMLPKLGVAYGGLTESRGIGIVAGCGRSSNVAKSYSHTALDHLRAWFKRVLHGDNGIEEDEERPTPVGPPTQLGTAHVVSTRWLRTARLRHRRLLMIPQ